MSDDVDNGDLESRLRQAEADKTGSYDKRTEHLNSDGSGRFINRLILEDSPYLLQHAHNPVNWYAWGEEAFAAAAAANKPIFLSIGYSTCHWCHVMEVESFDNVEVARVLNRDFISIKMDREQYPDIDEIYMTGVQLMSGQGGWPMSNFLLPDGRPFFAATYFPPPTFLKLLQQIVSAWREKYDELEQSAASVDVAIKRILGEPKAATSLNVNANLSCVQALLKRQDKHRGGLAGAPKFPQEPLLLFMLDQATRNNDVQALDFVRRALNGMAQGGIYDQVGGGFHRYSVDEEWLVPHFEKMLYNQSQLALVYLQAWQQTGDRFYERVLRQTLDYVCRDMQNPDGGFYSATDADSEGAEGTFFLWTPDALAGVLEPDELELATEVYGVTEAGNFEGATILALQCPLSESAAGHGDEAFYEKLDVIMEKLYRAREQRVHPLRDDKLIVAWNGAMMHTLALAGNCLGNADWVKAAERAAQFLNKQCLSDSGRLMRISLDGAASIPGQLEDYANYCAALITLHDVSMNRDYLRLAARLMNYCLDHFWVEQQGGFYLSPSDQHGPQLTRSRNAADGATLSPVATAISCLQRLRERSALLDDNPAEHYYQGYIDKAVAGLYADINDNPLAHTSLLRVIDDINAGAVEPLRFAGAGLVRISIERHDEEAVSQIQIRLTVARDWHLTAAEQSAADTVPLSITLAAGQPHWELAACRYPQSTGSIPSADADTIATYEGEVHINLGLAHKAPADRGTTPAIKVELTLQLCDNRRCLLPETLTLYV